MYFFCHLLSENLYWLLLHGLHYLWQWDGVFSWPGLVDTGDQGKCYPLSQVPLFNTAGSCSLKHFPAHVCLHLWLCSRRLNVCVKRFLGPSAWAVSVYSVTAVIVFDFLEASSTWCWCSCISVLVSSSLHRTNKDWPVFRSRSMTALFWLCLFAAMHSDQWQSYFLCRGRAQFTPGRMREEGLADGPFNATEASAAPPFSPLNSLPFWKCW